MRNLQPSGARPVALVILTVVAFSACRSEPNLPTADDPAAVATLPMQLDGAHASVEVTVNGKSVRMLLDTGADQIVLTSDAARRLGLPVRSTATPGSGAAGTYSASVTTIADLSAGAIHHRKLTAYVVPVPEEFIYDGVLGTPFFAPLLTTLDYQQRAVTLRSHGSFELLPDDTQVPIRLESGKLLVLASAAGVTGWFSVDTGAGNALTFFTPTVKQYGLRNAFSPSVHTITGVSPGGYTRGTLVRVPDVTIGPYVLNQIVVELSEAEQGFFANSLYAGNLGGELWRRFKVTLDYPGGRMALTPNDAIGQPFIGPRSGLVPSLVDGAIQIVDVVEGSPAAEAGFRIGEVIVAINGASTGSLQSEATRASFDETTQALRAAPGTQVRLTVRAPSGAERDVTLLLRALL
jgi:clan AA aspartic protease (TIGR02281 family)